MKITFKKVYLKFFIGSYSIYTSYNTRCAKERRKLISKTTIIYIERYSKQYFLQLKGYNQSIKCNCLSLKKQLVKIVRRKPLLLDWE